MSYENFFLVSLSVTILSEVPVLYLITRYFYKLTNIGDIVLSGVLASALTLPYFWFVLPAYVSDRSLYIILGESVIVIVEAIIYFKLLRLKFWQAVLVSLIANLVSVGVGLLVG